ncbi:MAG: hypothetical protein Hyperionvirus8_63 [Hyperionvirus sp.]|uniref:Uncharacterized protein n=1 Tax=Hyperionvirus sp. TaxID=2487770 RepID=A0A3G5ADX8_9VIRU|nr:MAG: hypothetical protein Hyperionvirus8_63 [Hyperionvirus sp.]
METLNKNSDDISDVECLGKTPFKYPKSKNNFQCLGPCYQPNTSIVHPLTLEYVTDKTNPFCPVKEWEFIDKETGQSTMRTTDLCYHPTESKDLSGKEFELNILTPNIDFNDEQFLKIFYNIHSFEDAVNWIDGKKYTSILTRGRIMDCAWNAYGKDVNIIDHRVVEFYIELIKKKWMKELYKELNKYVRIEGGQVLLGDPNDNSLTAKDEVVVRTNFLIERFVNHDEIYKFLIKYLKHRKNEWETIVNHSNSIKMDLIKYIENKIKMTIDIK